MAEKGSAAYQECSWITKKCSTFYPPGTSMAEKGSIFDFHGSSMVKKGSASYPGGSEMAENGSEMNKKGSSSYLPDRSVNFLYRLIAQIKLFYHFAGVVVVFGVDLRVKRKASSSITS